MEDLKTNLVGDVRTIAGVCAGRRRAGVADRLRECVEPADRARDRPAAGAGRPRRARRHARARDALPARRKRRARGRRRRSSRLPWRRAACSCCRRYGATYFPRTGRSVSMRRCSWLMAGARDLERVAVRPRPGVARHRRSVDESLRSGRSSTGGAGVRRLRRSLVAAQFAIATPLLIVAGLLLGEPRPLAARRPRFRRRPGADRIDPVAGRAISGQARINAFWDELKRRLRRCPAWPVSRSRMACRRITAGQHNNFDLEQYPAGAGESQPVTPWLGGVAGVCARRSA